MDDDDSYKGQDTISSALKNPNTAFYYNRAKVLNRKEYKTCQVKKICRVMYAVKSSIPNPK